MKKCRVPNYNKEEHSNSIILSKIKFNNIDELIEGIYSVLEGLPFSTDIDDSKDEDNYAASIDELVKLVLIEISKIKNIEDPKLLEELNLPSVKSHITKALKRKLLPKPLTKAEIEIQAIINGTDLVRDETIQKIKYKSILSDVYGTSNPGMDAWRKRLFEDDMALATIVDTKNGIIVDSDKILNNNIISYLESLYKIIRDYLTKYHSKNITTALFPEHLYVTSSKNGKVRIKTLNHYNTITAIYNIIESLKKEGTFLDLIEDGWNEDIDNVKEISENRELYKVTNAFINLVYFDDILKLTLNKFINIEPQLNPILFTTDAYGASIYQYKYKLAIGNSNYRKTWGDTDPDALEEMAKFSLVLINRISLYDYKDEVKLWGRLEPKDFIGTIVKLKSIGTLITDDKFSLAVETLSRDESRKFGALLTIFKKLFIDKNSDIITELDRGGFDYNNMNVLYSIFTTVFDSRKIERDTKSWIKIEENYLKNNGIKSRYNLVETIFELMCSNTALNYLQTVYDTDLETYKTTVKEKYSISKTKFDIINDINESNIKNEDRQKLLDTYKLTPLGDQKSYIINIAGIDYKISVSGLGINILSKKNVSSESFDITNFEDLNNVDFINTREKRNNIVGRHNLNTKEELFLDILTFIDTMLNTDFSINNQTLNELTIAIKNNPTFLKLMFMSAARALVILDIYNDFNNAIKDDNTKYAVTELRNYLKKSGKFPGIADSTNLYAYFRNGFDGDQLTTVDYNEPWIIKLANIRALLANDTSKSVISNLEGNKLPNFSPFFPSGEIKTQMEKSARLLGPTSNLLFSKNRRALLEVTINTDVKTKDGKVKLVKNMTEGELIYDAIINKFLLPLTNNGTAYIQSTTLSDKTKFISNHINLKDISINSFNLVDHCKNIKNLENGVISLYMSTIGLAYNEVYDRVINDYKKLFPSIRTIDDINRIFKGQPISIATGLEFTINSVNDLINAVNAYNRANPNDKLTFYKDTHYREVIGSATINGEEKTLKRLAFNELLYEFATNLYNQNDSTRFRLRLAEEKIKFLKNLLKTLVSIPVDTSIIDGLVKIFGKESDDWIENVGGENYLILAKSGEENILYGNINNKENIELNPILEAYFLIDNLIGNNIRFSTTGSEINHKIKELSKLDLKKKIKNANLNHQNILLINPNYDLENLTFYDLKKMIDRGKELITNGFISTGIPLENTIADLEFTYNDLIYLMENLGLNALFKRNVIMSATMNKITPNLEGICKLMNIACISDVPANVFNFSGKTDKIDAHDGSALISPFWSILENKSLGPNEVGTIKKPILHFYDDKYMTATLLKYATDTITNQWMRLSIGNDLNDTKHAINLHNVFRRMHNKRWHNVDEFGKSIEDSWVDGKIDLIYGCEYKDDSEIIFSEDILELSLHPNNELYYNKSGEHIKIVDFGKENNIYYTIELVVDAGNKALGESYKVYHYFDNFGNHIPSNTINEKSLYHTIDSLYELHTALGGIWSESFDGENFVYSEASNIAVANYINHVATLKDGADPNDLSINSYDLPLKRAMIHVIANNSAVKNGVGNINPVSSWYDDTEFSYMTIDSDTYGIQLDSDHTADEALMTEFSLVINSLDAGGNLHDYVSQIYSQLGLTALDLSRVELDAVKSFKESGNVSDIYDVVGRTIMANIRSGKGEIGLAEAIINNIKKKFNLNTDHALDKLKIPFSDPNIYSSILSTFVSNINKKSIKRKYPGLGTVMVPSFNISMIYDINGMTYQFQDLIKEASEKGFTSVWLDNTKAKLDIVRLYLKSIQDTMPEISVSEFIPTENVLVTVINNDDTINYEHISLNGIYDYYNFTENPIEYLINKGYTNIKTLKFQKDVTIPRNLAPARIEWDYEDKTGIHHTNIFNHWRVKGLILELNAINNDKTLTSEDKKKLSKEVVEKYNVNKAFSDLKKGIFEISKGNEIEIVKHSLKNEAAEIIMSNLYASKFGINPGDSLVDVLKKGRSYFRTTQVEIESENYDLVFTKGDGKHTFITFKPLLKNTDNCSSYYLDWDNINKVKYNREIEVVKDSPTVVNRVYAVTEDNVRLFEIGREIIRTDIVWDSKSEVFVKSGKLVKNLDIYRRDGDRVLQYVEFVSKHRVSETAEDGSIISYDLYNINRNAIKQCLERREYTEQELSYTNKEGYKSELTLDLKFNLEANKFISHLLGNIYKSDDYGCVLLNRQLSFGSGKILQETLYSFSEEIEYDLDLSEYVKKLSLIMYSANPTKDENKGHFKISNKKLKNALAFFDSVNQNKQYLSFKKALYFTVARIPALTLQSFMKMKNVGFTGTETGQCFVTAWQTWLLGSKINNN